MSQRTGWVGGGDGEVSELFYPAREEYSPETEATGQRVQKFPRSFFLVFDWPFQWFDHVPEWVWPHSWQGTSLPFFAHSSLLPVCLSLLLFVLSFLYLNKSVPSPPISKEFNLKRLLSVNIILAKCDFDCCRRSSGSGSSRTSRKGEQEATRKVNVRFPHKPHFDNGQALRMCFCRTGLLYWKAKKYTHTQPLEWLSLFEWSIDLWENILINFGLLCLRPVLQRCGQCGSVADFPSANVLYARFIVRRTKRTRSYAFERFAIGYQRVQGYYNRFFVWVFIAKSAFYSSMEQNVELKARAWYGVQFYLKSFWIMGMAW